MVNYAGGTHSLSIVNMNSVSPAKNLKSIPRSSSNQLLWIFGCSIAIWGFDFKALTGHSASAFQSLILVVYIAAFLWIFFSAAKRGFGVGPLWVLICVTALFLLESSVVGLIKGQPVYAIAAN